MAQPLLYLCLFMLAQNLYLVNVAAISEFYVPTSWKKIFSYHNDFSYPLTQTYEWSEGLKNYDVGTTLAATESLAPYISAGQAFEIQKLEYSYIDDSLGHGHNHVEESMDKASIYGALSYGSIVEIPARTLLTMWQLVANVAGHEVGYNHTMETYGNTIPHIHSHHHHNHRHNHRHNHNHDHYHGHHHNDISRATLDYSWKQPIYYGTTKIRIRHQASNQYLAVARTRSRMSPATLSSSIYFEFILYNSRSGIRIRTLNPGYRGYEWLTSDARGQIHFTRSSRSLTQYWDVNDATDLYDGAVVTFRNNGNGRDFLRYYNGQLMTGGTGDRWHLETV